MSERGPMSVARILGGIVVMGAVLAATPAAAATPECFLKVDGVAGESADARHRGEIDLLSWTLGVTNSPAATAAGAAGGGGRSEFQPLKVNVRLERAVPSLVQLAAAGQHVREVALACRRPGREAGDYLRILLAEVLVTGVRLAETPEAPPSAEISVSYGKITIDYRPQMPDGSLGPATTIGWDVRANKRP